MVVAERASSVEDFRISSVEDFRTISVEDFRTSSAEDFRTLLLDRARLEEGLLKTE